MIIPLLAKKVTYREIKLERNQSIGIAVRLQNRFNPPGFITAKKLLNYRKTH